MTARKQVIFVAMFAILCFGRLDPTSADRTGPATMTRSDRVLVGLFFFLLRMRNFDAS